MSGRLPPASLMYLAVLGRTAGTTCGLPLIPHPRLSKWLSAKRSTGPTGGRLRSMMPLGFQLAQRQTAENKASRL